MNREEIENSYDINEYGIIVSLGKFEGEMIYAPYYYDLWLNDSSDEEIEDNGEIIPIFSITQDDIEEFPELEEYEGMKINLWESEQGFVYLEIEED